MKNIGEFIGEFMLYIQLNIYEISKNLLINFLWFIPLALIISFCINFHDNNHKNPKIVDNLIEKFIYF